MRENGRRVVIWKMPEISADGLKNFACVMTALHTVGLAVVENGMIGIGQYTRESLSQALSQDSRLMFLAGIASVLQLLGGMAVPLFAYLLVEGFLHTGSYRRYLLRVLVFAAVSEIPYDLAVYGKAVDFTGQNALVSMTVSLLMLYFLRMLQERRGLAGVLLKTLIVCCAVAWVSILHAAFGLCVVLLAAVFYLFHRSNGWKMLLGATVSLLYVTGPLAFYGIWCCSDVRRNKIPKYAYYAFYPLTLLLCAVAAAAV